MRPASLRIEETRDLDAYRTDPGASATETPISPADAAFETIMMAFRTKRGLDTARFRARFGVGVEDLISRTLATWKARIVAEPGSLALDPTGLDLLNRFLVDCLAEMETSLPARFESRDGRGVTGFEA
jgi:coproporphyrinogen III oxidase-like Fe-S oxidoreductase